MALGDGTTWDESTPTAATSANLEADYNRDIRKGIRSRMAREHEFPASQSVTAEAGAHKFITLQPQGTKPTLAGTQNGAVYINTATPSSLMFEDSAGTETNISTPVPSGGIIMYSGSVSAATALAPVWYVCNGSNSTPNLQDKFILCAGSTYAAAGTGGAMSHILTSSEMPSTVPLMTGTYIGNSGAYVTVGALTGYGGGQAMSLMPSYYTLAFIMKA